MIHTCEFGMKVEVKLSRGLKVTGGSLEGLGGEVMDQIFSIYNIHFYEYVTHYHDQ